MEGHQVKYFGWILKGEDNFMTKMIILWTIVFMFAKIGIINIHMAKQKMFT